MGRASIFSLHDCDVIAVVAAVSPAGGVDGSSVCVHMEIATVLCADWAATSLKVAAPCVALRVGIGAVGMDVPPSLVTYHRGKCLVVTKCSTEPAGIGRRTCDRDVPCLFFAANRSQARCVELEYLIEAVLVERLPLLQVMCLVGGHHGVMPESGLHGASTGLRMLQLRHSEREL